MTTQLDTVTLPLIAGHDNTLNVQAMLDGAAQNLTGKTLTAKVKYTGTGSPLALTIGAGLVFINEVLGQFSISLTSAQIGNMAVDGTAYCYLTVWNPDNSIWAHGKFPMVISLG
jgi:hypothetical protein